MGTATSTARYGTVNTPREPTEDLFVGCLVGQCIGDSLGFLVEGEHTKICSKFVKECMIPCVEANQIVQALETRSSIKHLDKLGQYSDDSQLARELLISYTECNGVITCWHYAKRIANIVKESRIVGCGKATAKAAAKLNQGGSKVGEAGNGTAMRAAPIGLMCYDTPELLITASSLQSKITHKDPRCAAGAVAIAGAVSLCLRHSEFTTDYFLEELSTMVSKVDTEFGNHVKSLKELLTLSPKKAAEKIGKLGQDFDDGSTGISGFVTSSVIFSLYAFLRSPFDFVTSIATVISAGGDTDSTAAMTGSISGAFLGLSQLPKYFVDMVHDKGTWKYSDLQELALKCYHIKKTVTVTINTQPNEPTQDGNDQPTPNDEHVNNNTEI